MSDLISNTLNLIDPPKAIPLLVNADLETDEALAHLITEDDTPVDNLFSAKQQRLLVESLYQSWQTDRQFIAEANVGVFHTIKEQAIVPDMFLSMDVSPLEDLWAKRGRSYFNWIFGKPPDVVIEIVSNKKGGEADSKLKKYALMPVPIYVIFDPLKQIGPQELTIYQYQTDKYIETTQTWFSNVQLSLRLWAGVYEDTEATWLRWYDPFNNLIMTGAEADAQNKQQLSKAHYQLEQEYHRANHAEENLLKERQQLYQVTKKVEQVESELEQERQRAELLAAKLKALGFE